MDSLSKERRSWNMSRIRSRDTSPELAVRSILHRLGYRFRLHAAHLPGKPDIILPKWKHAILVHGCFWHRHKGCEFAYTPKSRVEFWDQKFEQNMARDAISVQKLKSLGWRVTTIWECQTKDEKALGQRLTHLIQGGFE
jgi:DNA mismatch endonuclease (patch repair protein)